MEWHVERRYKEFAALHETLEKEYRKHEYLPPLPPKFAFPEISLEKRFVQLQQYLNQLVLLPDMTQNVTLLAFFGGKK